MRKREREGKREMCKIKGQGREIKTVKNHYCTMRHVLYHLYEEFLKFQRKYYSKG